MERNYEQEEAEKAAALAKAEAILAEHGIALNIAACGCCCSPWVKMTYRGEFILGTAKTDLEKVQLDMIGKGQADA